jgi:hypothetical protein
VHAGKASTETSAGGGRVTEHEQKPDESEEQSERDETIKDLDLGEDEGKDVKGGMQDYERWK